MKKILLVGFAVVCVVLLVTGLLYIRRQPHLKAKEKRSRESPSHTPIPSPQITTPAGFNRYSSRSNKFSFLYRAEAQKEEFPKSVKISYAKRQVGVSMNAGDLKDGYIMEISFLRLHGITAESFATDARTGSFIECSRQAFISPITDVAIAGRTSKTFSTNNCIGNTKSIQYYIPVNTQLIQITVTLAGDINTYEKITQSTIDSLVL